MNELVKIVMILVAVLLGGVVTPLFLCWASDKWGWFK